MTTKVSFQKGLDKDIQAIGSNGGGAAGALYLAQDTGTTYFGKDDGTLLRLNDTSGYVKKSGDTMTGQLTTPIVSATNYFVSPSLIGQGGPSTYYHRIDFGHYAFDHCDFHEVGGTYNFYQNIAGTKDGGTLIGAIQAGYGWKGKVNGHTVNANVPADAKFTDTVLEWGEV